MDRTIDVNYPALQSLPPPSADGTTPIGDPVSSADVRRYFRMSELTAPSRVLTLAA